MCRGGGGGGGGEFWLVLVLYYLRSYASVYDIKENAYMLYWKSVDHVQSYRPDPHAHKGRTKMIV